MLKRSTSVSKVCDWYDFCSEKNIRPTPDVLVEKICNYKSDNTILYESKNPFPFIAVCHTGDAQTDNSARAAQELVISVSDYVELTTAQTSKLSLAATQYVEAVKSANSQYTDDAEAMIKAKANAWQDYTMQLRSILSDEQYQTLLCKQQQHKQAVMNQIKGGTKQ